jgi:hypothetical protein
MRLRRMQVRRSSVGLSLAGNAIECLTITNHASASAGPAKKGVIISGRVHPGESNASFVVKVRVRICAACASVVAVPVASRVVTLLAD